MSPDDDRPAVRRPTTVAGVRDSVSRLRSPEGEAYARTFRPRPSDVIIATYPKSGTTWMQQIVHGLRTGGAMDFKEITATVPWIEMAHDLGHDLDAEQAASPRAFKSHDSWDEVPKGCRYITIMRDPRDVAVSFFHFFQGWYFEPGSISLDSFTREFFLPGSRSGRYWDHLASWWPRREAADTLFLCYEDMKADLPGTVRRVAGFLGLEDDAARITIATRQASMAFMTGHARQFDDHLIREARDAACGLPPGGVTTKVRSGKVGSHKQALTPALCEILDAVWRQVIEARLGYPSYEAIRAELAEA